MGTSTGASNRRLGIVAVASDHTSSAAVPA